MAITDPRDISGLLAWYSPEHEEANYNDGDQITTLTDLSGNGNHATGATTSTAKPLYKATGGPSGGAQRLRFENGGYFNLPSGIMGSSAAGEIMCMIQSDYAASGTTQGFHHFGSATQSNHYGFSGTIYDDFGLTTRTSDTPNLSLNAWRRLTIWSAASDWDFLLDGVSQGAYTLGTVGWATVPKIGNSKNGTADNTSTNTFEGDYGAIVLYSKKLSSTERSDLATWMAANPSGGVVASIPEVAADMTGSGVMSAVVVPVIEVAGALTGIGTMSATIDEANADTTNAPDAHRVPLTVRVGNKHITREVSGLSFRKEAVGGLKSISLRLARRLDRFDVDLDPLSEVYVYDGRTAEIIAQGRLADPGRSASAGDGQQWDMVAFPPGLADRTFPYVVVDTNLESFTRSTYCTPNASTQSGERDEDTPSLLLAAEEGKTVGTSWIADMANRGIRQAGMKLARVRARVDSGVSDADYVMQLVTRAGTGAGTVAASAASSTTAAILSGVVVTDFTNGHDVCSVRVVRNTSGTTGAEAQWFEFWEVVLRAMLKDTTGTDITTGYSQNYVLAHEVVKDLLGRKLDQIDGANSVINTGATYQIDQLAYPDGVTAEQVLTDLMALEPAYRYWIEPDGVGGYVLHWEPWSLVVRYEVTLDGGGDFPSSSQELYNEVTVRWRGANGRTRTVTRTLACQILDDAGVTRSTIIDAGDEIGSTTGAARLGDNFLADHNVPANAGAIVIDRPIRDLLTGRIVRPHQIEPGNLIRVRGVESYPDALNPDGRDGLTIFRIWSVTYNSDSDAAVCELDIPSRSAENALVKLAKRRTRKR